MPSKYQLETENGNLRHKIKNLEAEVERYKNYRNADRAQVDGYIRAFKVLIKIFPQFAAYRRRDEEDNWGTLYTDLISEDMEQIKTNRDDARKRRLFGEQTREN